MSTYFDEFILERDILKLKDHLKRHEAVKERAEEIVNILKRKRCDEQIHCDFIRDVKLDPDDELGETVLVETCYNHDGNEWDDDFVLFPLEYLTKTDPEIEADEEHYAHLREEARRDQTDEKSKPEKHKNSVKAYYENLLKDPTVRRIFRERHGYDLQ